MNSGRELAKTFETRRNGVSGGKARGLQQSNKPPVLVAPCSIGGVRGLRVTWAHGCRRDAEDAEPERDTAGGGGATQVCRNRTNSLPKTKNQEPRAKSQEPRAKSQEPRAK